MARAFFDVNFLIAYLDFRHVHNRIARQWWREHKSGGWASSAITENGAVRIMSQESYPMNPRMPISGLVGLLAEFKKNDHEFWPDDVSITDAGSFLPAYVTSHRKLTDIYLLALAAARGGTLVTFDSGINLAAVPRAQPWNLTVVR